MHLGKKTTNNLEIKMDQNVIKTWGSDKNITNIIGEQVTSELKNQ